MPKPQKHVFVCTQSRPPGHPRGSCGQNGCVAVMDEFLQQLQYRNLFETIAVTNTACLGPCGLGTTVLVYPEGVMYSKVKPEDVSAIYEEHLIGGHVVERLLMPKEIWS